MTRILAASALATVVAVPAFAQGVELVCDDFLGMDNAQQMASVAEIQGQMSEMDTASNTFTAEQIHERLTADCASQPDVLVIDVVKAMK
jgi:hypothetical protein